MKDTGANFIWAQTFLAGHLIYTTCLSYGVSTLEIRELQRSIETYDMRYFLQHVLLCTMYCTVYTTKHKIFKNRLNIINVIEVFR